MIVYAGAPSVAAGDVPSSSWVNEPTEADYARENLARFFQDLGINTVDVLILSTVRTARGAYEAVQEKEYLLAAGLGASVVCDVTLKVCKALAAPVKGIARLVKSLGRSASFARAAHPTFKPGPYAGESIPARGPGRDLTDAERAEGRRIFNETGCHTCGTKNAGTKNNDPVLDHQPVSALNRDGAPQRLYPQCLNCSRDQGLAVIRVLREEAK